MDGPFVIVIAPVSFSFRPIFGLRLTYRSRIVLRIDAGTAPGGPSINLLTFESKGKPNIETLNVPSFGIPRGSKT